MRQAIVTKFLGPTNFRGARVKASSQAGNVTVSWDDALGVNENHAAAAKQLATELGWEGSWYGGGLPDGSGNAYVRTGQFMDSTADFCAVLSGFRRGA